MSDELDTSSSTGSTAAAASAPAAAAAPATPAAAEPARQAGRSAAESAFERAAARRSATTTDATASTNTSPAAEQAPVEGGASTPVDGGSEDGKTTATPAAGATGAATPAADSTVQAPADWPEAERAKFDALPPEGRDVTLGFYKRMQGAFTQGMQTLARERQQHAELVQTAERFQQDPKGVLQVLAQQAGVPIFFTEAEARGEIPEFETQADMAAWVARQTEEKLAARQQAEREQLAREHAQRTAGEALARELGDAAKAHPDFAAHQPRVLDVLRRAPGLTVEEAYGLATLPGLLELARAGRSAQTELAALKAEAEKARKAATAPATRSAGSGSPAAPKPNLSPAEAAFARAEARLAAARNGARA